MKVLPIKKYNEQRTQKWEKDWEKAKSENRNWTCMPQLAFYVFNKSYGYVAFDEKQALWAKSKKDVIAFWKTEETRKKIRGY